MESSAVMVTLDAVPEPSSNEAGTTVKCVAGSPPGKADASGPLVVELLTLPPKLKTAAELAVPAEPEWAPLPGSPAVAENELPVPFRMVTLPRLTKIAGPAAAPPPAPPGVAFG